MTHFSNLRKTIKQMENSGVEGFNITKSSTMQALEFLDFLEIAQESSIKMFTEDDQVVFTTQTKDKKYFLTCNEDNFDIIVIDMNDVYKRLATVK